MRDVFPVQSDGPDIEWDAHPAYRQLSMAAWFSAFSDGHGDLDRVVQEACTLAAVGVRARFAGVLQFRADQRSFVLQAGTGWDGANDGSLRQAADLTTTAGIAWHTGQLIHFRGLHLCGRVRAIGPMRMRGVQSVLSVPVRGSGLCFGVLEVGSAEAWEFSRQDASFLQSLADDLAAAVVPRAAASPPALLPRPE